MADDHIPNPLPPTTPERPLPSEESVTPQTGPRRTVRLQKRNKVPNTNTGEKTIDHKSQSPGADESPSFKVGAPKNFPRNLSVKLVRKRASPQVAPSSAKSVKALVHWLETGSAELGNNPSGGSQDVQSEAATPPESRGIETISEHDEELEQCEKKVDEAKSVDEENRCETQPKQEDRNNGTEESENEKSRIEGNKGEGSKDDDSHTEDSLSKSENDKSDDKTCDKNGDKNDDKADKQETPSRHKTPTKYLTPDTIRRRFSPGAQTAPGQVSPEYLTTPRHLYSVNSTLCRPGTDPTKRGLPSTRFTPEEIAPRRPSHSSYITRPIPIALLNPRSRVSASPFRDKDFVIPTDEFIGERDSLTFLNQKAYFNNRPLGRCLDGLEEDEEELEKKAEGRMTDSKSKRHAMTIQFRLPSETRRGTVSGDTVQQVEGVKSDPVQVMGKQSAAKETAVAEPPDEEKRSLDEALAFWNSVRIQLHIDDDELDANSIKGAGEGDGKEISTIVHNSPVLNPPAPVRVPPPTPETVFSSSPPLAMEPLPTLPSRMTSIDHTPANLATGLASIVSSDSMYSEPELPSSSPLGSFRNIVGRSTPPAQSSSPSLPVPPLPPMPANLPSPGRSGTPNPRNSSAASRSTVGTASSRKTSHEIGTSRKTIQETDQRLRQRRMTTDEKMEEIDLILSDDSPESNH